MMRKGPSSATTGIGILLLAALFWGIGNAITGFSAHQYLGSAPALSAIDIALANTVGGLVFVALLLLGHQIYSRPGEPGTVTHSLPPELYRGNHASLLASGFKGVNTALYVLSTVFVLATKSIVFESTYILWSLLFGAILLTRRIPLLSTIVYAVLLFVGVVFVSGDPTLLLPQRYLALGALFGVLAGVAYSSYLTSWAFVTREQTTTGQQLASTVSLLLGALVTILVLGEVLGPLVVGKPWIPLSDVSESTSVLQIINGAMVIGLVYFLVTRGMAQLRKARESPGFIAAICLSCSIVFTLVVEVVIRGFRPNIVQLLGVGLFILAFALLSRTLATDNQASGGHSRTETGSNQAE